MKRIISCIFGGTVIALLVLTLAYQQFIKQYAVDYITTQLEQQTGYQIQCTNVQLSFPFTLHIDCTRVLSQNEPIATINELDITLTPWDMLHKNLIIDHIYADNLLIENIPTSSEPLIFNWDLFPANIKIDKFKIGKLELKQGFVEEPLSIQGSLALTPSDKNLHLDLKFARYLQPQSQTQLIATLQEKQDKLEAQLRFSEDNAGLVSTLSQLPQGYKYHGHVFVETPSSAPLSLRGDFQLSYANVDTAKINPFLGASGVLKSPFAYANNGQLECANVEGLAGNNLLHGQCRLGANGECDGTSFEVSTNHSVELQQACACSFQHLKVSCVLTGNIAQPEVHVHAKSKLLTIQGNHFQNLNAHVHLSNLQMFSPISLKMKFEHDNRPWKASGTLQYHPDRQLFDLANIELYSDDLSASGNVHIEMAPFLITGSLKGHTPLDLFKDAIPHAIQGTAQWTATFSSTDNATQAITIEASANEIHYDDTAFIHPKISVNLIDPLNAISGDLNLTCEHMRWKEHTLSNVKAQTKTGASQNPFSISAANTYGNFASEGLWNLSQNGFDIEIGKLDGHVEQHPFTLISPLQVSLKNKRIQFSPLAISINDGTLRVVADNSQELLNINAQAENIPLELFAAIDPTFPAHGKLSGTIDLKAAADDLLGDLQLELSEVNFAKETLATPSVWSATISAQLKNNQLDCTSIIHGIGPHPLNVTAQLPVNCTARPFHFAMDKERDLAVAITAEGDIESLLELISPITTTNLKGNTSVLVNISGSLKAPQVHGTIDLSDGTFEILDIGSAVKLLKAHMVLDGDTITMTDLSAIGEESGYITGHGTIKLDFANDLPFDMYFNLTQLGTHPTKITYVTATGPINFTGNTKGGNVKGKLVSDSFEIKIPEQIPELTQTIAVKYINQPEHLIAPTVFKKRDSPWPLTFNVDMEVPLATISGKDWTSTWKGAAVLGGDKDNLLLNGTCKAIRGEYKFNGKAFDISEGTITLAGDPEKKTSLYIIASKDLESIHVEAILKGDLFHPAIVFRSNPPMSQREILSWILFNRGTSEITSFQGTQLNESITNLSSGNKKDILTTLRDRIGIDKIEISNSDTGSPNQVSLQVGKYVSSGILVSIQKSITAEANRLAIEADVVKHLKLQAEVGDDAAGQLRLKWKKDY